MILLFYMVSIFTWHPIYDHVCKNKKRGGFWPSPYKKNHDSQSTRPPEFSLFLKKINYDSNQSDLPFSKLTRFSLLMKKKIMFLNRVDFFLFLKQQAKKKRMKKQKEWLLINRASLSIKPSFNKNKQTKKIYSPVSCNWLMYDVLSLHLMTSSIFFNGWICLIECLHDECTLHESYLHACLCYMSSLFESLHI